ncbi:hypothetical protein GE061_007776 [Apolygus lucorum]|uniref:Uncharacterized protein n=1 Tax=Apolygus lucorum TaxID=248454 RepID=A0A8S9WPH0_APOLU|nr:hypothetical protein GE061_007776 [Apolygus lucorum]
MWEVAQDIRQTVSDTLDLKLHSPPKLRDLGLAASLPVYGYLRPCDVPATIMDSLTDEVCKGTRLLTTAFCWFYHLHEAFTRFTQRLIDDGHTDLSSFCDELLVHSGMWEVAQDIRQTVSDTLDLKLHSPPKLRDLGLAASLPVYGYLRPCDVPATIMDSLTDEVCKGTRLLTTAFCWFYHLHEAFTRFTQRLIDDGHTDLSSFCDELLVHSGMWEVAQDIRQTVSDTLDLKLHSPPKLRDLGLAASLPVYGYLRPCDVPATIMDSLTDEVCKGTRLLTTAFCWFYHLHEAFTRFTQRLIDDGHTDLSSFCDELLVHSGMWEVAQDIRQTVSDTLDLKLHSPPKLRDLGLAASLPVYGYLRPCDVPATIMDSLTDEVCKGTRLLTTAFCWFYHLHEAFTRFTQRLIDDGHTDLSSFCDELLVHSGMWEVAQDIRQTVSDTLDLKLHSPPKLRDLGLAASLPVYGYLRPCDVPATIMDSLTDEVCKPTKMNTEQQQENQDEDVVIQAQRLEQQDTPDDPQPDNAPPPDPRPTLDQATQRMVTAMVEAQLSKGVAETQSTIEKPDSEESPATMDTSLQLPIEEEPSEPSRPSTSFSAEYATPNQKKKKKSDLDSSLLAYMREPIDVQPPDDHESFFESLLPIVRKFNDDQTLEFRTEITSFNDVEYHVTEVDMLTDLPPPAQYSPVASAPPGAAAACSTHSHLHYIKKTPRNSPTHPLS